MVYDNYAIVGIKKQILKKKFLLEELCNSIKGKSKWITVGLYLISAFTGILSSIDYIFPELNIQLVISALAIGTMILFKVKSFLNYDYIKELCKKQLVKYDLLFQKIERGITKHSYDQTDEEEFILCLYRELNVLENNDPEISNSIYDKFSETCKKMQISYNDTINQLAELYGRSHKQNKSYGSDLPTTQPQHEQMSQTIQKTNDEEKNIMRIQTHVPSEIQTHVPYVPSEIQTHVIDVNTSANDSRQYKNLQQQEKSEHDPIRHVDDYAQSDVSIRGKRVDEIFGDLNYGNNNRIPIMSPNAKNKIHTLNRLKNLGS